MNWRDGGPGGLKKLGVSKFGGAGRAATRRASQREARHLEIGTLPKNLPDFLS